MDGNATVGGIKPDVDVPFSDLLKDLSGGAMLAVDVEKSRFGLGLNSLLVRVSSAAETNGVELDATSDSGRPFVNYNLPEGWFLVSAPIITANGEADSDDRWVVPLGGGGGRVLRTGPQPVNIGLQACYNVEKPKFDPDWSLRFAVALLFPK